MLHFQAPVQYTKLFSKLVDQVPSKPWTVMGPHLSKCLNVDLEDVFDFVQENPIAAASIGQVHRARLVKGSPHNGSRDVVVKVCYPNSEALVGTVLHIHTHCTPCGARLPNAHNDRCWVTQAQTWPPWKCSAGCHNQRWSAFTRSFANSTHAPHGTPKVLLLHLLTTHTLLSSCVWAAE